MLGWYRSLRFGASLVAPASGAADPKAFRSGRDFSAWIGLVPKQNSSGGKDRLGSISKRGDRYLRSLFTTGALAVIRYAKIHGTGIGLGSRVADAATHEGRGYRTRQQDRKDGVGNDGQGRTLQGTRRTRGVNEITPGIRRDVKVGRANST